MEKWDIKNKKIIKAKEQIKRRPWRDLMPEEQKTEEREDTRKRRSRGARTITQKRSPGGSHGRGCFLVLCWVD